MAYGGHPGIAQSDRNQLCGSSDQRRRFAYRDGRKSHLYEETPSGKSAQIMEQQPIS